MNPAAFVVLCGAVVGACGWVGMVKHRAKAYGYLLYCLSLFALGTITMVNAPTLASICLAGICYAFSLLTIFAAASGQRKEGKTNAQQSVHEGQGNGLDAEEDGHRAH